MGWKNWSYWLKGGVIGLVLEIIIVGLLTIQKYLFCKQIICFYQVFNLAGTVCMNCNDSADFSVSLILILGITIVSILIGSIIGWIVGKIKSRNNSKR